MRFRDYFSVRHIVFAAVLMGLMVLFAIRQSNNTVKVYFSDGEVQATSAKYTLAIPYDLIASAELQPLAEAGDRLADTYDDDILRAGIWTNAAWGEYYIVADLDVKTCIVAKLTDGRTFVFSRKNDTATAEDFAQLNRHLQ